ncbi:unnamed protein product [Rotaria sordida]|uniref:Tetratricopeptide repeat protein n=1 Tax=Rotaria sordida TaxID=392033 RepID=A0A815JX29_9BILA|nr:unnamed protein product [Rotaria sordida]CAF1618749.1 unnamed protein product [Rotaria sordida]
MLNRPLREQNVETIMKIGFFLHDLRQQIVNMHNEQSKTRDHNKFFVYRGQGMASTDIEKKALHIHEKLPTTDDLTLATTYNNIDVAYRLIEDYTSALSSYEKALVVREKSLIPDDSVLATIYSSIESVYHSMKNLRL